MDQIAIGSISGALSAIITNPLDVIKTRMQLQGEMCGKNMHKISYKDPIHAAYMINKYEGFSGFVKGMLPSCLATAIFNGIRLGSYDLRSGAFDDSKGFDFKRRFLAAMIPAAVGGVLANPFFLMKVQLQSRARVEIAHGYQHKNEGRLWHGMKRHMQHAGVPYFFSGATYTIPLICFASAVQLLTFDYSKYCLENYLHQNVDHKMSIISGIIGGIAVTFFTCPGDVVSTRIFNQGYDANRKGYLYKGFWDCWYKTFYNEGLPGLYKGMILAYFRLGPYTLLTLSLWDELRWADDYLKALLAKWREEERRKQELWEKNIQEWKTIQLKKNKKRKRKKKQKPHHFKRNKRN